jgi:hypothetical protein
LERRRGAAPGMEGRRSAAAAGASRGGGGAAAALGHSRAQRGDHPRPDRARRRGVLPRLGRLPRRRRPTPLPRVPAEQKFRRREAACPPARPEPQPHRDPGIEQPQQWAGRCRRGRGRRCRRQRRRTGRRGSTAERTAAGRPPGVRQRLGHAGAAAAGAAGRYDVRGRVLVCPPCSSWPCCSLALLALPQRLMQSWPYRPCHSRMF